MSRLKYPTRPEAEALVATANPGDSVTLDAYSTAERATDGDLLVMVTADSLTVALAYGTEPTPHWTVVAQSGAASGAPMALPEAIVVRANRLMLTDGVSVQRDWRTKTHVLRAAARRVLPIRDNAPVSAALSGKGWVALNGSDVTSVTPPTGTPSAPTPAAPAASVATPAAHPAPSAPAPMPVQGIPAAYSGKMVLDRDVHKVWEAARAVTRNRRPMVVALVGPSGAGKTHAVHALAHAEGLDVVKFDASGVVEPGDWFGTVVLDQTGTDFVKSDLLMAIITPGARVLLIDEVNRANLRALNAMLPLLDGSGTITIPQSGKVERVNPQVQIVVTANIGSAFLGTEPLDEAIRTRNGAWIEIDHLSEADEAALLVERVPGLERYDADNLARLGHLIREAAQNGQHPPVSTRQLLAAAELIAEGLDARLAVDTAVLNGYLTEGGASSERARVKPHVVGIAWKQPTPGQPGQPDLFTGSPVDLCTVCQHTAAAHGMTAQPILSPACTVTNSAGQCQCATFSPATVPA